MTAELRNIPTARERRTVLAAFAGTAAGALTLAPALRRLRRALPHHSLVLLRASSLQLPVSLRSCFDGEVCYRLPADARSMRGAVDGVAAHRPEWAIVFTETGWSSQLPAYLAYLAGVPRRSGIAVEFCGGMLTDAIAAPPQGRAARGMEERRHLSLLDALGFLAYAPNAREVEDPFPRGRPRAARRNAAAEPIARRQ